MISDPTWSADHAQLDRLSLAAVDLRHPDPSESEPAFDQAQILAIASSMRDRLLTRLGSVP